MVDSARIAKAFFSTKPAHTQLDHFLLDDGVCNQIREQLCFDVAAVSYSSLVSFCQAIDGIGKRRFAWAVVQLYYCCYYTIKAHMVACGVVPFNNGKEEYLLDLNGKRFFKGGKSSHNWNWNRLREIGLLDMSWIYSQDSQEAYEKMRHNREEANYRFGFSDPDIYECLISEDNDFYKRFRTYRDDENFFYTYLSNHLVIAYPTKLIFNLEEKFKELGITLPKHKADHVKRIWTYKDRCPLV